MAYIRAMGPDWDLDETTEFLVVAATLLDLKAARLLPAAEVEDEARPRAARSPGPAVRPAAPVPRVQADRRHLQRAASTTRPGAIRVPSGWSPTMPSRCPKSSSASARKGSPRLAVKAMQPKPKPQVYVDHIHAPLVSVQEQAAIVVARLRELGTPVSGSSPSGHPDTLTVVGPVPGAAGAVPREGRHPGPGRPALGDLLVPWSRRGRDEKPGHRRVRPAAGAAEERRRTGISHGPPHTTEARPGGSAVAGLAIEARPGGRPHGRRRARDRGPPREVLQRPQRRRGRPARSWPTSTPSRDAAST
ncbi:hypothetical protein SVIOM74S_04815 [Streptomyces violarus]